MDSLGHLAVSAPLVEILCDELHVDSARISRGSRLVNDVGLDWIALAIAVVAIEDRWGIALSERELGSADTGGELDDVLMQRLATAGGHA